MKERAQVLIANHLWMATLNLASLCTALGGWAAIENPEDAGAQYPSFWLAQCTQEATSQLQANLTHVDQCQYGQKVQKPTTIWNCDSETAKVERWCNCERHEFIPVLRNKGGKQVFASAELARYPPAMSKALAQACIERCKEVRPVVDWCPTWRNDLFPVGLRAAVTRVLTADAAWQL